MSELLRFCSAVIPRPNPEGTSTSLSPVHHHPMTNSTLAMILHPNLVDNGPFVPGRTERGRVLGTPDLFSESLPPRLCSVGRWPHALNPSWNVLLRALVMHLVVACWCCAGPELPSQDSADHANSSECLFRPGPLHDPVPARHDCVCNGRCCAVRPSVRGLRNHHRRYFPQSWNCDVLGTTLDSGE